MTQAGGRLLPRMVRGLWTAPGPARRRMRKIVVAAAITAGAVADVVELWGARGSNAPAQASQPVVQPDLDQVRLTSSARS